MRVCRDNHYAGMINISIVMPVFNTAEYLKESIESILQQTYTEFELICVNDASTDNSYDILREYQQCDARIVIVNHETNSGAAVSRNDGLKAARGEYVIFLDSDDYFYPGMLETSYKCAAEYQADVAVFGSETLENGRLQQNGYRFRKINSLREKELFLPKARHVPWDKLVRRKLLTDNHIWFQDIPTNNDVFYSFAVLLKAERIIVCDDCLLRYRYGRAGSLTAIRFSKTNHSVEAFYALYHFVIQNKMQESLVSVFMNVLADNLQSYLSEQAFPLEIRKNKLSILMQCEDMIQALSRYERKGALYPHNRNFVQKMMKSEDVCDIEYFQYYWESVGEIVSERRNMGRKTAIWGCGKIGKELLELLDDHSIAVDYVVDENVQLQGESCGKYRIHSYDEVSDDIATVLITNLEYEEEIVSKAVGKEVIYVWK